MLGLALIWGRGIHSKGEQGSVVCIWGLAIATILWVWMTYWNDFWNVMKLTQFDEFFSTFQLHILPNIEKSFKRTKGMHIRLIIVYNSRDGTK